MRRASLPVAGLFSVALAAQRRLSAGERRKRSPPALVAAASLSLSLSFCLSLSLSLSLSWSELNVKPELNCCCLHWSRVCVKKKKTPGEKERERERLPWFSTTNMKWDTFPSDPESTIPSLLSSLFELDVRNKK